MLCGSVFLGLVRSGNVADLGDTAVFPAACIVSLGRVSEVYVSPGGRMDNGAGLKALDLLPDALAWWGLVSL